MAALDSLAALEEACDRLEAEVARRLREFDRTQGYAAEGALLCRRHHRKVHEGGWRLAWNAGRALTAIPP